VPRLVDDQLFGGLDHLEGQGFLAEPQIFGGDEAIEEDVDAFQRVQQED
jgi:hypothetical protein